MNAVDPDDIIVPAVKGTVSVLQSALAHGDSVKRIIATSSTAAVFHMMTPPFEFTENDWNEPAVEEARTKGRDAAAAPKYWASKTLAERAAWEFYEKNKSKVSWDLVVLCPPFVYGPILQAVSSPNGLNESMQDWYQTVFEHSRDNETLAVDG